jgi:hypothetical protein
MIIQNEDSILDEAVRSRIIQEIKGSENQRRKDEAYKRYEVYKDLTSKYVVQRMLELFNFDTVQEMSYALSNISILRKIVNKLARVYNLGVKRAVVKDDGSVDEEQTKQLEDLSKLLAFNSLMKKTNRGHKRDKNTLFYAKPVKVYENDFEKWDLDPMPLFPYLYDVIENPEDRTKPMVVVLSHYQPPQLGLGQIVQNQEQAAKHSLKSVNPMNLGDKKDQSIADTPSDQNAENDQYIWWSNKYHFTTDCKGRVISEDQTNELGVLPFDNFAEDQDGAYWAIGGSDLVDGSILINSLITHTNHIGVTQGYGQFYMTGKNLPSGIKIGPSRGIKIEYDPNAGEPAPQLGFLSANPPLESLMREIEMYVALLLTTNNLSVSGVATQLGTAQTPAAGISLIIDKAESMEDVKDQEQIFIDKEPLIWKKLVKWINLFKAKKVVSSRLEKFTLSEELQVILKFPDPKPIMSESEKLDNIQKRKDLGLNSQAELLMLDDPSLTTEMAEQKLLKVKEENMIKMSTSMIQDEETDQEDELESGEEPGDKEANLQ